MVFRRAAPFAQVVVPDHRELDRGTPCAIRRQAGLSVTELVALLSREAQLPECAVETLSAAGTP